MKRKLPYTCPVCKSSWPAATSVEAYRNYRHADRMHPDKPCDEVEVESQTVWVLVCEKPEPNDHDVPGNIWLFDDQRLAVEGASTCDAFCSGPHQLYKKEITSWQQ